MDTSAKVKPLVHTIHLHQGDSLQAVAMGFPLLATEGRY